jgi:glyoxylase-like metal-dependent hydrolase (beta-lactamase superfamily II)
MLARISAAILALALAALPQAQQDQPPQGKGAAAKGRGGGKGRGGPDPVQEKARLLQPPQVMHLVRPGLYMIANRGGNVLVRPTGQGMIVVDTKLPGNFDRLMELVRGLPREPVRYVFNTHHHLEQTGNNAGFLALGAAVIGPEELQNAVNAIQSDSKPAPPSVAFVREHTVALGGVEVRAYRFGPGHTGGDAVVYFPGDRVIALGGLLTVTQPPEVDYASGGSLPGWIASLDAALQLEWDVAVGAEGPPQRRPFVEEYRRKLQTLLDRGRAAVARGLTGDPFRAELKAGGLGWELQGAWLDGLRAELAAR